MMRSPRFFAVACRKADQTIVVKTEPIENSIIGKLKWLNKPFLRGTLALLDAMALGTKALTFSAQVQAEAIPGRDTAMPTGEVIPGVPEPVAPTPQASTTGRINDIAIGGALVFAICFGLALFVALPTFLTQLTHARLGIENGRLQNVIDGLFRITIFLVYIGLIARMENIRRVFQYHGAEHKAINTLEAGEDLTLENAVQASRIHPRCGTSFIIIVLLASIIVHSLFPRPSVFLIRTLLHLALVPLVAGFAYETIRLAGRFRSAQVLQILLAPGLWSQRLTTRVPSDDQVEVALAALDAVLVRERELGTKEAAPSALDPAAAVA